MKIRNAALFVLVVAMALPLFGGPQRAGKWQMTIQTDIPNMPMKMPPVTVEQCVTKEQAERPEPPKSPRQNDCKVSDYKIDGSTVSWTMTCEKQHMTGEGKITYSAESFEGSMHMKSEQMDITSKYSGKRIGDCEK